MRRKGTYSGRARADDDLRLQFEAISQLDDQEKEVVWSVLEGLVFKSQAQRLAQLGR